MIFFKKQYFIFGASIGYGVGGTKGGWAGLLKMHIHNQLYGKNGISEKAEVYNFAKPGAQISFVLNNFKTQLDQFKRSNRITVFLLVGLNDVKSTGCPDNYLSSEEKFKEEYSELFSRMSSEFGEINVLGYCHVDESKLNPKVSPFDGSKSYFNNKRIGEFNGYLKEICSKFDKVKFISMDNISKNWVEECLFEDGLHPNDLGHKLIFERIKSELDGLLVYE